MIFNVNESVNHSNSGIESAQYDRFKVFRKHRIPFKLVTVNYNTSEAPLLLKEGVYDFPLKKDEYINLYDYYQGLFDKPFRKLDLNTYKFGNRGSLSISFNNRLNKVELLSLDGKVIYRFNFYDQKKFVDVNQYKSLQIKGVEIFDNVGNLIKFHEYNCNGYLSKEELYNPDNSVSNNIFYDEDGKIVIENRFIKVGDKLKVIETNLYDKYNNYSVHNFDSEVDLRTYFYNELNNSYDETPINIFVLDRSSVCQESLFELKKKAFLLFHYHNSQGGNVQDEMYSVVNNNYEYALTRINDFNGSIVATSKQRKDMINRYHPTNKIYEVPVGTVSDKILNEKRIPINERINHSIIMTARIAPEKQMEDVVYAVKEIKKKYNDVTFDIYGAQSVNSDNNLEFRKIQYLIKKYKLENNVHVHGYAQDVNTVQRNHQIYAVTSTAEGFNIALMEGLSQGDIGLVYDTNYGPNELVINNVNGYIVKQNDWKEFTEKVIYLFDHPKQMQKMSDAAYDSARKYSEDNIFRMWREIITDAFDYAK